jgi:hypothetical protein
VKHLVRTITRIGGKEVREYHQMYYSSKNTRWECGCGYIQELSDLERIQRGLVTSDNQTTISITDIPSRKGRVANQYGD